ncbi:MAG: rod shape-determining protein RodA [Leptospiraceae bacterium]|nr:rod shape-determining protein RodA [Leptospiraceae bacterium]
MRIFLKLDWILISLTLAATWIGIITLFGGGQAGEGLAIKKMIWLLLCIAVMFAIAFVNYQTLGSYSVIIYGVCLALLILTLVPFIGTKVKGARSWLRLFGFGFQPAEFMKLALVLALAKYLVLRENEIGKLKELVIPIVITLFPVLFIILQPDLGYAMLFMFILFLMLLIGGANVSIILGFSIVGFFALLTPMFLEYQKYILVDDVFKLLSETNFRLADAVRILKFDVWTYMAEPGLSKTLQGADNLTRWAAETLTKPENLEVFKKTVEVAESNNRNFLRDYLRSDIAILITIGVTATLYGLSSLGYFATRTPWMKKAATITLIITLSFLSGFLVRKTVGFKPHQVIRIVSFANPDKFPKGAGYQLRHSLITLGSGQITGKGLFSGDMTKGEIPYLPEWYNDFIFSVIGEQFGLIGTSLTLIILFGIVFRGIAISLQSKDDFGGLLAAGITSVFLLHILINVGITLGLFPVTGIPLIFISSGGSNLLSNFIAIGILLNINMRRFINA